VTPKSLWRERGVENGIRALWKLMNISNDRFIRTTDDYHVESIQKIFGRCTQGGYL
jgi:methionyl-tRNA synthetase